MKDVKKLCVIFGIASSFWWVIMFNSFWVGIAMLPALFVVCLVGILVWL